MLKVSNAKIIDIRNVIPKKIISIGLLTAVISTSLFSGCMSNKEQIVQVPNEKYQPNEVHQQIETFYNQNEITSNNEIVNIQQQTNALTNNEENNEVLFAEEEIEYLDFEVSEQDNKIEINSNLFKFDNNFFNGEEKENCYVASIEYLNNYTGPLTINLEYLTDDFDYSILSYLNNVSSININYNYQNMNYSSIKNHLYFLKQLNNIENFNINLEDASFLCEEFYSYLEEISNNFDNLIFLNCKIEIFENLRAEEYKELTFRIQNYTNIKSTLDICIDNEEQLHFLKDLNFNNINLHRPKYIPDGDLRINLDEDNFEFLKTIPNLNTLSLELNDYFINFDLNILNKFNIPNLELEFNVGSQSFDFDFNKIKDLNDLKAIKIIGKTYDIPVYLDNDILEYCQKNNIKIIYDEDVNRMVIHNVNNQLDEIIAEFNLKENATDYEKLNSVLAYVLESYEYDEDVANNLVSPSSKYEEGMLDPAFNNETIICGNYAALVESLLQRLGMDSLIAKSQTHSWNIVNIEGEYYYVDSCWLDGNNELYTIELLKNNNIEELKKDSSYMTNMEDALNNNLVAGTFRMITKEGKIIDEIINKKIDADHEIVAVPNIELDLEEGVIETINGEFENIEISNITSNKYVIEHNNKKYIVSAGVLMGILLGLGAAKKVNVKLKENDYIR